MELQIFFSEESDHPEGKKRLNDYDKMCFSNKSNQHVPSYWEAHNQNDSWKDLQLTCETTSSSWPQGGLSKPESPNNFQKAAWGWGGVGGWGEGRGEGVQISSHLIHVLSTKRTQRIPWTQFLSCKDATLQQIADLSFNTARGESGEK